MCEDHSHGESLEHQIGAFLAEQPGTRRTGVGFIGYGEVKPGDRILVGVDNHYHPAVISGLVDPLRERGARVDVVISDIGPDRPFNETDEIDVLIRRGSIEINPRRWDAIPWIERRAVEGGYDLLIHKKGGGIPVTDHRYEAVPWQQPDQFGDVGNYFPRDVHRLINIKTWEKFWDKGAGGRVRLTDPEGTDLEYTLWTGYRRTGEGVSARAYSETPFWGHLMGHGPTPILPEEDTTGVIAGTTNHFSRAFPRVQLELRNGRVVTVHGGGGYGDAWRALLGETSDIKYPCFPEPGLFYLWEVAIGTHPKIHRPANISHLSSGGFEWERRRSGVIHLGLGSAWGGEEEKWAAEKKVPYGHLHVHLLFPTLTITTVNGDKLPVIENGHLTALDDPEVIEAAARHGDPKEILSVPWEAPIPGISMPGSYAEYAADPAAYIYA